MTSIPFDTLKLMERLENAGFTNTQAKAQAEVLAEVIGKQSVNAVERFSSKQEMAQQLTGLRASADTVGATVNAKIDTLTATVNAKIDSLGVTLNAKIDTLDATLNAKIDTSAAEVKSELIRWVVSVGVLQMALIAGLVLKLTH